MICVRHYIPQGRNHERFHGERKGLDPWGLDSCLCVAFFLFTWRPRVEDLLKTWYKNCKHCDVKLILFWGVSIICDNTKTVLVSHPPSYTGLGKSNTVSVLWHKFYPRKKSDLFIFFSVRSGKLSEVVISNREAFVCVLDCMDTLLRRWRAW